jgi:uncharacterized membrane protein YeiH
VVVIPVPLELTANAVGAFSGALHAIRRGADVIGVLAIAVAVGLGGGMLRDVLLGAGLPLALRDSQHLEVVAACAVIACALGPRLAHGEIVMRIVDATLVGLWVVLGIQRARGFGVTTGPAMFFGVLTAVGGGLMRDILAGERTALFAPGVLYASPALFAASAYFIVLRLSGRALVAELSAVSVATLLRAGALWRGWRLPTPGELPDRLRRLLRPPSTPIPQS